MLVFIHIQKTAGRTVRYILRSSYGLRHCEVEPWHAESTGPDFSSHDLRRLRTLYPKLESIAGHRVTGHVDLCEDGTDFRYFTFMREPLERAASYFQYKTHRGYKDLVFDEYVQREWPANRQTRMIAGSEDADEAIRMIQAKKIFVGLTERFDESMVMLKRLLAKNLNISYRLVNVAQNSRIAKSLLADDKTRQLLIESNREDVALYEFVRSELYPSYQREYGESLVRDVAAYRETRATNFNEWNLTLSRLKQFMLYKPLLYLYRRGIVRV